MGHGSQLVGWADCAIGQGRILSNLNRIFRNWPRLWKFKQRDLGGILMWGFFLNSSRILKILEKYNMPCYAMHPKQDYFLERIFICKINSICKLYTLL
jgi:hypothetical protein